MAAAYNGTEPYIFISYSHKDTAAVLNAVEVLNDNGFRVWYDNGIEAGTEWPEYIAERLINCQVVIAFMSRSSQDSHNCRREIHFAIELKKELLVVYLEDFDLSPGMRLQLSALQAMFRYKYKDDADFLSHLCSAAIIQKCKAPIEIPNEAVVEEPETTTDDPNIETEPVTEALVAEETVIEEPEAEEPEAEEPKEEKRDAKSFNEWANVFDMLETPSFNDKPDPIITAINACNADKSKKSFYLKRPTELTKKQLDNSVTAIAKGKIKATDILAMMDDTMRGNGKSGFIVTKDRFFSGGTGILCTNFDFELKGLKNVESPRKDHLVFTFESGKKEDFFFSIYAPYFLVFFKTYIAEVNN